jgi:hypothetical protein
MQPTIVKTTMNSGLIMGFLFSINFLLSISRNSFAAVMTYVVMSIILVAMYRMTVAFRDKQNGGSITYGKSFTFIVYTFFFAGLLSSAVKYIYFTYINPNYLETLLQESLKMMDTLHISVETASKEEIMASMKASTFSVQFLWMNVFLGVIVGLLFSAFIQKKLPPTTESTDL